MSKKIKLIIALLFVIALPVYLESREPGAGEEYYFFRHAEVSGKMANCVLKSSDGSELISSTCQAPNAYLLDGPEGPDNCKGHKYKIAFVDRKILPAPAPMGTLIATWTVDWENPVDSSAPACKGFTAFNSYNDDPEDVYASYVFVDSDSLNTGSITYEIVIPSE